MDQEAQIRKYDAAVSVVFRKTGEAFGGLSNMAPGFSLQVNGICIRTSEALYQACRFPRLPDVQRLIIEQRSPMAAKMRSKRYRHDSRRDWNRVRVSVMRWCLRVKLAQNWDGFSKLLLDTGGWPIVEHSRNDDFWGAKPVDNRTFVGMNVLGRLLMELRESVKAEPEKDLQRVGPLPIPNFLLGGRPIEPVTGWTLERGKPVVGTPASPRRYRVSERTGVELPLAARKLTARPLREDPSEYTLGSGGNVKPYPDFKDSGVSWLGKVPDHWEMRRLKNWLDVNSTVLSEDTDPDYRFDYLDIGSVGTGVLAVKPERIRFEAAPSRARRLVRSGDTIVSTVRTYLKAVWHAEDVPGDLIASTGFAVLTPRPGISPKFVSYLCQSEPFTDRVTSESVGIAYPAIAETKLGTFDVSIPPLSEQTAIVRFLDHVDRCIRRYIGAKQKLIALLEEQKQAIIHQAVTGQIDVRTGRSYPAYKPSGVEWLGRVPVDWEVLRLGRLIALTVGFPFKSDGFTQSDGDMRLLRGVNIAPGRVRWEDVVRWAASDLSRFAEYRLQAGDIVLGMDRPVIGGGIRVAAVAQSDVPSLLLQRVARIRPKQGLLREFALRLLGGRSFSDYLAPIFTGVSVPHLSPEQVGAFPLALPSMPEQVRIVECLRSGIDVLHAAVEGARDEIALIDEYRTRLIADVVTGKLDVREAVAWLPEVDSLAAEDDLVDGADHDAGSERARWRHGEAEGRAVADVPVAERRGQGPGVG